VYVLSNMALKMSIGLFLLRIVVEPVHKYIILTVLVITELFGTVFFFLFVFQCQPTAYFWNQFAGNGATGKCLDTAIIVDATYAYSAVSCWGDWTFSIIPIFVIRNVQMTPRTKFLVVGILAMCGMQVSPFLKFHHQRLTRMFSTELPPQPLSESPMSTTWPISPISSTVLLTSPSGQPLKLASALLLHRLPLSDPSSESFSPEATSLGTLGPHPRHQPVTTHVQGIFDPALKNIPSKNSIYVAI